MKIGIDIDEVLAEFMEAFFGYYESAFGEKYFVKDIRDYYSDFSRISGLNRKKFLEIMDDFYRTGFYRKTRPVDGAVKAVGELSGRHELFAITARSEKVKKETMEFLEKHFLDVSFKVFFSNELHEGANIKKEDICKGLGIGVLVEDSGKYAICYAEAGIKVLLLDKPWNQGVEHENIIRVNNWDEVLNEIRRIENGN